MQLSKRLQAVADLVTPGNRVADVGCDHAYTSIYLAVNGISPRLIAMDINQGPLNKAKENIQRYGCEDRIELRLSDGLSKLNDGEADSIIIGGMGGSLTISILTQRMELVSKVKELILQPQSEIHKVREMLTNMDFVISNENMVKEEGKYYTMMKAVPAAFIVERSKFELTEKEHYYYGRQLLEQRNKVLHEFLLWDLNLCENIMETLAFGQSPNSIVRQEEIKERMKLIAGGLSYYRVD